MTSEYHFGDEVTQYGDHNVGMIKGQGSTDPQLALREMISAIQVLRDQVPPVDRQVIDESVAAIGRGDDVDSRTLRRALGNIAGVATMVGQVGIPVIEAVRGVMSAFGI